MKGFLVDEDLPRSLAGALSAAGLEAIHVADAGLRGRSDAEVLAEAVRQGRALVTGSAVTIADAHAAPDAEAYGRAVGAPVPPGRPARSSGLWRGATCRRRSGGAAASRGPWTGLAGRLTPWAEAPYLLRG